MPDTIPSVPWPAIKESDLGTVATEAGASFRVVVAGAAKLLPVASFAALPVLSTDENFLEITLDGITYQLPAIVKP